MIAALVAFFNAISAIPQIAGYLEQLAAALTVWYMGRINDANKGAIADAAAFALRAKTPQDRADSLDMWAHALSRTRVLP